MVFRPTDQSAAPAADEIVDFIGARVFVPIKIPRTEYKGQMRIVSRSETFDLKVEARRHFAERGFPLDNRLAFGAEEWDNEVATRMLAVAIRSPRDPRIPLTSLDEWRELDDDQIDALWREYQDHAARIDPIGHKPDLTPEDVAGIRGAAKKGELALTMSFGSRKLALYAMRSLTDLPTS
jgi:hypothetical protein